MAVVFVKMFLILLFLNAFCNIFALEQVVIVHAPESIKFLSSEPLHSSYLGDVFSAMLAYTIRSNVEWNSLAAVTPWKRPSALVVLEMLGFDNNIDIPLEGPKFLLENAGDVYGQFDMLSLRTEERYFGKRPVLLRMDFSEELHDAKIMQPMLLKSVPADPQDRLELALEDPELGELVRRSTFNASIPSDVKLLTELATVKEFLKALSAQKSEVYDGTPDIYWLKIGGLDPITATYGTNSLQFHEGLRLLRQMITEVEKTMRSVYDDNVVVSVIKESTVPSPLGRGRRLLQDSSSAAPDTLDLNLARQWDPMFAIIFIIILFIGIMMTLAVLGISVAMWTMDPGRDSIIYRMTSQRMKKD